MSLLISHNLVDSTELIMNKAKAIKKKLDNAKGESSGLSRISVYIYDAQIKKIDEICKQRNKTRRIVFFEAFQNYISLFEKEKV